jgi:hypothetical protein
MKGELGGFQLRGVRREDEWGRKGEGGTSRMHASRHFTLKALALLCCSTVAKFKVRLICQQGSKKGGGRLIIL